VASVYSSSLAAAAESEDRPGVRRDLAAAA